MSTFAHTRKERPDGSQPTFVWNDIAWLLNSYPAHYKPAFAFSIIFCPQSCQLALQFTSPYGSTTGLPCSAYMPLDGLGVCLFAGGFYICVLGRGSPYISPHYLFGSSLSASLACWFSRRLLAVHICYPYRPILAPVPPSAGSHSYPSRVGYHSCGVRLHCPRSYRKTKTVAFAPRPGRIPVAEY